MLNIKIGDRITFRAPTRWSDRAETRVVKSFWVDGRPQVRFGGTGDFIVRWHEIKAVNDRPVERVN